MSNINLCNCKEEWKKINNYYLSSKGRVISDCSYPPKKNDCVKKSGYCNSSLGIIHSLVYYHFIEKYTPDRKEKVIDHINTIKNHNCICNLRLCSQKDNINNKLTIKKANYNKYSICCWCNIEMKEPIIF